MDLWLNTEEAKFFPYPRAYKTLQINIFLFILLMLEETAGFLTNDRGLLSCPTSRRPA
jgi:hypothetical protein